MHTRYSDGHGSHRDIAAAALAAGVDAVIVTDHNVWVNGAEQYVRQGGRRVLVLIGEEVHDASRDPQKNHLLVLGADAEVAHLAHDPQLLIHGVGAAGGLSFLAHPFDTENKTFHETDITWEAWEVGGYTGVELWNGLSEFKSLLRTKLHAAWYGLQPRRVPHAPPPEMLAKWDELHRQGRVVAAVGGSDAHQLPGRMGPFRATIFPYAAHFRSINTHVLTGAPLNGEVEHDKRLILDALRDGHCFIGNDLPAPTDGFRFGGQGPRGDFVQGDTVPLGAGVTLQIRLPLRAACRLLKDGALFREWHEREAIVVNVNQPGVYRVECSIGYLGRRRGWIYSNPVYVREGG
jgi:hypothetical protein